MDLKGYYQKLRQLEAALPSEHVVVVSKETPDGGRAGTLTEVPRRLAAKLILDGAAELATEEQAGKLRHEQSAVGRPGGTDQRNVAEEASVPRPETNKRR